MQIPAAWYWESIFSIYCLSDNVEDEENLFLFFLLLFSFEQEMLVQLLTISKQYFTCQMPFFPRKNFHQSNTCGNASSTTPMMPVTSHTNGQ